MRQTIYKLTNYLSISLHLSVRTSTSHIFSNPTGKVPKE